jgi:hypothetical protein
MGPLPVTVLVALAALVGCQKQAETDRAAQAPYRADLENICDAEARSGALAEDPARRALAIAQWIGPVLKTQEARDFLAGLTRAQGKAKGDALRAEAARVGLSGCALADTWR